MRRATLILLLLSVAFCVFVFYSLLRLEPLKISGGRLEHLGNAVVVTGHVINDGSAAQSAVLKVQFYDRAGHRLAVQSVALGRLAPGQSTVFTSPPAPTPKAEKFTIQIDRGANMYGN
jgi:hypothetical protein